MQANNIRCKLICVTSTSTFLRPKTKEQKKKMLKNPPKINSCRHSK